MLFHLHSHAGGAETPVDERAPPGRAGLPSLLPGRDELRRDAFGRDVFRRDALGKDAPGRVVFGRDELRRDVFGRNTLRRDAFGSDAFTNRFTPGLAADAVPGDTGSISIAAARSNRSPGHPFPQPSRSPGLCLHRELRAAGSWTWSTLFKAISINSGQLGLL